MVIPEDFLEALQQDPAAQAFYGTLKRQSQFAIYYRLHNAKRPETRQKRMAELLAKLVRGENPLSLRLANDPRESTKNEIYNFISA